MEPRIIECKSYDDVDKVLSPYLKQFKDTIRKGDKVFINPNLVSHEARKEGYLTAMITHPKMIEVVVKEVRKLVGPKGKIIVGDAPTIDADWSKIYDLMNFEYLEKEYNIETVDLRKSKCWNLKDYGNKKKMDHRFVPTISVDLGYYSSFNRINPRLFRSIYNDRRGVKRLHSNGHHIYHISQEVLSSDVYIAMPKLKTHYKVGMTCNLKGLVGIVTDKECLPHWRIGMPLFGGDEYPNSLEGLWGCIKHLFGFHNPRPGKKRGSRE